jgi:hypothetical protein
MQNAHVLAVLTCEVAKVVNVINSSLERVLDMILVVFA